VDYRLLLSVMKKVSGIWTPSKIKAGCDRHLRHIVRILSHAASVR